MKRFANKQFGYKLQYLRNSVDNDRDIYRMAVLQSVAAEPETEKRFSLAV